MPATMSATTTRRLLILDNDKLRRANAKVTTATAYKKGDLLALSEANVASHATDEKTWDVFCGQDISADEATSMAAAGIEMTIHFGGVFSIEGVSLAGTLLEIAKYDAARAKATKNKIELAKV